MIDKTIKNMNEKKNWLVNKKPFSWLLIDLS